MASATLLIASAIQAYGEISPYFASGFSPERRFLAVGASDYVPGSSLWSKDLFFRDCLAESGSLFSKVQPAVRQVDFLTSCLDQAQRATYAMPQYSRAWLVAAAADVELKRPEAFLHDLAMATRSAPAVDWLAERRSELAERNFAILDDTGLRNLDADTLTLLQSDRGRQALANRYRSRPNSRERLTALIEQAAPALQSDFLKRVQLVMSQGNSR